jgi:hypothetical protein
MIPLHMEDTLMSEQKDPRLEADKTSANERLRHEIDSGGTGDKGAAPDPAMAPLGTDAEAAEGHDEDGLRIARGAGSRPPGDKGPPD